MLVVGLSCMAFIMLRYISSLPTLLNGIFHHEWNFVKYFFFFKDFFEVYFERERKNENGGGAERQEEKGSQVGSMLSVELDAGLDPMMLGS